MTDSNPPGTAPPKKSKAKRNPAPPFVLHVANSPKPELVVHGFDLTIPARALAKLLAEQCENLFVQANRPVLVIPANESTPTIHPLACNEVIIAAHKVCQPFKPKDGERPPVTLPDKVAELYLAMPEEWRLRVLAGITTGPILHADGSIRTEPGYDPETRCLCCCNLTLAVPETPSIDDAKRALKTLRRAFRTHAFADRVTVSETFSIDGRSVKNDVVDLKQNPGKDESAYLVALLTAVTRASLLLAPAFAWRAPDTSGSGAGKDLLVKAISTVAFGNSEPRAVPPRASREELDKTITAELLRGEPFVYLQNFNGLTLQSPVLCVALTERHAQLRIMGKGEMGENATAFIAITGNALIIGQDLVRRVIKIDIDARCENPELREFAGDFLADIRRQRTELLTAALTIWRWGRQTKLTRKRAKPLGGYEQWVAWVRDPLLALGCQDPVARIAELKTSDPYRQATVDIFESWWEHHQDKPVKASELAYEVQVSLVPDAKKRNRQSVAARVAKLADTRVGGFHLTSNKGDKGKWTPLRYRLLQVEKDKTVSDNDASSDSEMQAAEQQEPEPEAQAPGGSEADDADDWQFNREGDDAAARPAPAAPEAPQGAKESSPSEQARTAGKTNSAGDGGMPAFITAAMKEELKRRGFSNDDIFAMTPQRAHDILADPNCTAATERYRVVGDAPAQTACLICNRTDGVKLIKDPRRGGQAKPLHLLQCAGKWFESDDLSDDILNEPEQREREPEQQPQPLPPDPVERWRTCFARLDPRRDPCAGFRAGDWARIHGAGSTFLAGPFVKQAIAAGWTERELFGVHPAVGIARSDACGALMSSRGVPVTQVTPQLIRFANGLAVYKARLSVGDSVAVWDYREPAAGERQQLARTPISESVTDSAEGEPGLEQPCAARRGRVQEKDGVFLHFCVECGRFGLFGYGVRLRAGQLGRWYCREHRPRGHEP